MPEKIDTLYICDWLPPDFGAVGQYSLIFAQELALEGRNVVLAGLSTQGDEITEAPCGEGRLTIIKIGAEAYQKTNFRTRLIWTVKVNTRLLTRLWREMRAADEILFTGSPPLLLHWIAPANLILRKRLVYRITDFHPECLIAARGRASLPLKAIYGLTVFWRRKVTAFEALGEDQRERLAEIGIPPDRVTIKPDRSPVIIDPATEPLERPQGAADSVLLLYSGNWGVAHDYETFLEAYRFHHREGTGRVVLWLNAVGPGVEPVESFTRAQGLPLIQGQPVPMETLANLLVTPDAHLITLSDAFVGFVLPSKVHGCVASNKPVLFVGSERSDVHRLSLGSQSLYRRVDVGDVAACAQALEEIADFVEQGRRAEQGAPAA